MLWKTCPTKVCEWSRVRGTFLFKNMLLLKFPEPRNIKPRLSTFFCHFWWTEIGKVALSPGIAVVWQVSKLYLLWKTAGCGWKLRKRVVSGSFGYISFTHITDTLLLVMDKGTMLVPFLPPPPQLGELHNLVQVQVQLTANHPPFVPGLCHSQLFRNLCKAK